MGTCQHPRNHLIVNSQLSPLQMHELNELDHQLTLAINGSDSIFWDNLMYTVTDTFSWTLVIIALLIIILCHHCSAHRCGRPHLFRTRQTDG